MAIETGGRFHGEMRVLYAFARIRPAGAEGFTHRGRRALMCRSRKCVLWGLVLFAVSFFMSLPVALAQLVNGTFTGTVTDQSGAVVPGAVVTATNEGTNVSVSQTANAAGLYTIPNLLPGFYTIKAEAKGFKTLINTHVEITTGYTQ